MIQIQELIKLLGLGIASLIICSITMAEIKNTKDFMKAIDEVRKEYPEESVESKIPSSFIATVAATETGNFQFKDAPTAKNANNFFGMHATGDQKFLKTTGGAKLRSFDDSKASIRAFLNLMANDERYKNVIESMDKVETMFKSMGESPYATNPNYTNLLTSVYTNRIKPIIETENMLLPKTKPIIDQMNTLK
jgi:flagellum-specific peptidoglycan hydrolase FlgJ